MPMKSPLRKVMSDSLVFLKVRLPGYDVENPTGGITGMAANLAMVAHMGQVRKVSGLPYIVHPFRVAAMVGAAGGSEAQIAAAWCHDVLEDCPAWRDAFYTTMPGPVITLVNELTKPIDPATGKGVKGDAFLDKCRAMTAEAAAIKMADRIDNLRDSHVMLPDWISNYLAEAEQILAICGHGNAVLADMLDFTIREIKGSHAVT